MPNQRGCAACAPLGSIRYAPLLVGWGVSRLKPEGCRARIQPIACFGAAGAAPSPVAEEGGDYSQALGQVVVTHTRAQSPSRPATARAAAVPRARVCAHMSTMSGHTSSGSSVHPSVLPVLELPSPLQLAAAAAAVRFCRCCLRARLFCPLLSLAAPCCSPPSSTPLTPLLLLVLPRRQISVRACVAPDLRRSRMRCSPP